MRDDGFDIVVVDVGGNARIGQHEFCIENVQSLVFHRAHVEIAHGDDHEAVQIEFQPVTLFIPADAVLEGFHRMLGLVEIFLLDPDLQQRLAAGLQAHGVFLTDELAGDQRKKISRLSERVFPLREMAAVAEIAFVNQVAVGQQHRILLFVRAQHHGEFGHHVGAIRKKGDFAEAFCFALCEEIAAGDVQAHQRRILVRANDRFNFQGHVFRGIENAQVAVFDRIIFFPQFAAIHTQLHQFEAVAVQENFFRSTVRRTL